MVAQERKRKDCCKKLLETLLSPFSHKLMFRLQDTKQLFDCRGFTITLIFVLLIVIYGLSAFGKLGTLTMLLQYYTPAVDSQVTFNNTFQGGIDNYLFDNKTYIENANDLEIRRSQFG